MEIHGIVVAILSIAEKDIAKVDAFSTSRLPRPLIVLTPDRADDIFRYRFTAAHELGHLMLHAEAMPGDIEQEREADRFAAELLTPSNEIKDYLPQRLKVPTLQELGRVWGVSPDSLIRRCQELGIASDAVARRAYQRLNQLRGSGLLRPEPLRAFEAEVPSLLKRAFSLAEERGLTLKQLSTELAWPIERTRRLLGEEFQRPVLRLV